MTRRARLTLIAAIVLAATLAATTWLVRTRLVTAFAFHVLTTRSAGHDHSGQTLHTPALDQMPSCGLLCPDGAVNHLMWVARTDPTALAPRLLDDRRIGTREHDSSQCPWTVRTQAAWLLVWVYGDDEIESDTIFFRELPEHAARLPEWERFEKRWLTHAAGAGPRPFRSRATARASKDVGTSPHWVSGFPSWWPAEGEEWGEEHSRALQRGER